MADLHDLTQIARCAADAATAPAYETLARKARVRRRRQRITGTVAAAAVVTAFAGGIAATRPDAAPPPPTPASPGPSTSAAPATKYGLTADQVVAKGDLYNYAVDAHGDLLSDWTYCPNTSRCVFAWKLTRADGGSFTGILPGTSAMRVDAGPDYFVGKARDAAGVLVRRDGSVTRLHEADHGADAEVDQGDLAPGAAAVPVGPKTYPVDPTTATILATGPDGASATGQFEVAPDGTAWSTTMASGGDDPAMSWRTPTGSWHRRDFRGSAGAGLFVVADRRVAAFALVSNGAARYGSVSAMTVASADGADWTEVNEHTLPFTRIESIAATADGIVVVSDGDRLYRSLDDSLTRYVAVAGIHGLSRLEGGDKAHPDAVYGYSYGERRLYRVTASDTDPHRSAELSVAPRQLR